MSSVTTKPLSRFIADNAIRATVKPGNRASIQSLAHDDWRRKATPWTVTLTRPGHQWAVSYWTGSVVDPATITAAQVLDNLASESAGVENSLRFLDWASDYGYDTDSRSAYAVYRSCETQAKRLRRFLGDAAYEELLWNVERE